MVIDCQPFEFQPVAQVYNMLAKGGCYAKAGGGKLPDGEHVTIWNLTRDRWPGCGVIPRIIVRVRKDGLACIWWEADKE
tara:strand:- start:517 stop:753 length:237 start_codon:yes stop_codon:yes gene_type:complete